VLKLRSRYLKAFAALAMVFAVLSAGFVVAERCHTQSALSSTSVAHSHENGVQAGAHSHSLLSDLCMSAFFLVLIIGAKVLLVKAFSRHQLTANYLFTRTLKFLRPPNLTFALSRPQLGIYRI
jgi:hypothetical protein